MNNPLLHKPRWDQDFDPASRFCSISLSDFDPTYSKGAAGKITHGVTDAITGAIKNIWDAADDLWDDVTDGLEDAWDNDLVKLAAIGAAIYFTGPAGAQWWGSASTGAATGATQGAMLAEQTAAFGAEGLSATSSALASNSAAAGVNAGIMADYGAAASGLAGGSAGVDQSWGVNPRPDTSAFGGADAQAADAISAQYAPGTQGPVGTSPGLPGSRGAVGLQQPPAGGFGATTPGPAYAPTAPVPSEGAWYDALWPDNSLAQYGLLTVGGQMLAGAMSEPPPGPDDAARKRRERFEVERYQGFNPTARGRTYTPPDSGYTPFQARPRYNNGGLLSQADLQKYNRGQR